MPRPKISWYNRGEVVISARSTISVKRTQRDYSLPFKLSVIDAVEKGELKQGKIRHTGQEYDFSPAT